MTSEIETPECCPRFDPTPWDGKIFEWNNKKFIKDSVITQFYMPLNFGEVIMRMNEKVIRLARKCLTGSACRITPLKVTWIFIWLLIGKSKVQTT
nr:hydrolase [Methanosarcina horonobensis]